MTSTLSPLSASRFAGWQIGVLFLLSGLSLYGQVCAPGTFDNFDGTGCRPASPGYYVPTAGSTAQIPSGAGYFVAIAGSSARTQASAGSYAPLSANTEAIIAEPGHYVPTAGASAQIISDAGYFVAIAGSTEQIPSGAGSYVPTAGATGSTQALAGTYAPLNANIEATTAEPGYYVPTAGASEQIPSGEGYYVPIPGSSSRIQTSAGTYAPLNANIEATTAEPGYYVPTAGASEQTISEPGYYVATAGASAQTPSEPGYYVAISGSTNQIPANSGFYVPSTASTAQIQNPLGTWSPAASAATRVAAEGVTSNGTFIVGPVTLADPIPGSTIDLGEISEPTDFEITLSNDSSDTGFDSRLVALSLLGITPSGDAAETITLPTSIPPELAPGESTILTFTVTPPAVSGVQSAAVTISTDRFAPYQSVGEPLFYTINFEVPIFDYDSWLEENFTLAERQTPAISGLEADPDGDGLKNIVEYGLGLIPKTSTPRSLLPTTSVVGGDIAFDLTLPVLVRDDVTYRIQTSETLQSNAWTTLAEKTANSPWTGGVTSMPEADGRIPYRLLYSEAPAAEKRFFRLMIETTP